MSQFFAITLTTSDIDDTERRQIILKNLSTLVEACKIAACISRECVKV